MDIGNVRKSHIGIFVASLFRVNISYPKFPNVCPFALILIIFIKHYSALLSVFNTSITKKACGLYLQVFLKARMLAPCGQTW